MTPNRLQVVYQRNFSLAMVFAVVLSLAFGSWVSSLKGPERSAVRGVKNIHVPDCSIEPFDEAARPAVGGYQPYADQPEGFLGFVRLDDHLSDKSMPATVQKPPPVFRHEPAPPLNVGDISMSMFEGVDTGIYIPSDPVIYDAFDEPEPLVVNQDVQVFTSGKPEYPAVARMDNIAGTAEIVVRIDQTGHLAPFSFDIVTVEGNKYSVEIFVANGPSDSLYQLISREEPKGWYFAQKLSEFILDSCCFTPAIENNKPVSQFVFIQSHFCMGTGCLLLEYRSAGSSARL